MAVIPIQELPGWNLSNKDSFSLLINACVFLLPFFGPDFLLLLALLKANFFFLLLSQSERLTWSKQTCDENKALVQTILPFKDQRSANCVWRQLRELSRKIGTDICTQVERLCLRLNQKKRSPPSWISNALCIIFSVISYLCYLCICYDVHFTCQHFHQCIEEHNGSTIGSHIREQHGKEPRDIELPQDSRSRSCGNARVNLTV